MINYSKRIKNCESKITPSMMYYFKRDMKRFATIVERKMKENNCTEDEAYELIKKEIQNIACQRKETIVNGEKITQSIKISRNDTFLISTIEKMNREGITLFDIIKENNGNVQLTHQRYTGNYKKNKNQLAGEYLLAYQPKDRTEIIATHKLKNSGEEEINESFKKNVNMYYERVKQEDEAGYEKLLESLLGFLMEYGIIEENTEMYNKRMRGIGLSYLEEQYEPKSKKDKEKTIKENLSKESMKRKKLSLKKAFTAFYMNRFVKKADSYYEYMYIARRIKGIKNLDNTSDEELKKICANYTVLTQSAKKIIREETKKADQNPGQQVYDQNLAKIDVGTQLYSMFDEKEYNENNGENALIRDLEEVGQEMANLKNAYAIKDWTSEILMSLAIEGKDYLITNWGYIPEDEDGKNSIQNKRENILIGFDLAGTNMPIKLHMSRERVEDLISELTENNEIPVYRGIEDFEISENGVRKNMSTQLLITSAKKKTNLIKKEAKEIEKTDKNYAIVKHLNWLNNRLEVPEYLQNKHKVVNVMTGEIIDKANERNNQPGPSTENGNR